MTDTNTAETDDAVLSTEAIIKACREALVANAPEGEVSKRLRAIEAAACAEPALHAQWLVAKGIATNRLGLRGEALGDLNEAADLFAQLNDAAHVAEAKREAAIVHSWCGEGREAGLALLRALGESLSIKDMTGAAIALADAGRLELEMGRPRAAAPLFDLALKLPGTELPAVQRGRAMVNQLQALVASGQIDAAVTFRAEMAAELAAGNERMHLLTAIEEIRCASAQGVFAEAHRVLDAARPLAPESKRFEVFELAEAEAELALAEKNFVLADAKIKDVIACFAERDLNGREVKARLLRAKALEALQRHDEAQQVLSTALRIAVMRGLIGHADEVRTALAASGGSENMAALDSFAVSPAAQDPGRRFVHRRALGAGAQASVYCAYDLELGGEVAVKSVDLSTLYDTTQREMAIETARTEIAAASRIDHPGVARVRGLIVEPAGNVTLIEDMINGPSLRSVLHDPSKKDLVKGQRGLDLINRIAYALSAIHAAKIVHCDLKPDNIMMAGPTQPVIVDFGIALLGLGKRSGRGTPAYMAPEQKSGGRIDARTDLFALGVIALEFYGIEPKIGRNFWAHDNDITDSLADAGVPSQCISLMRRLVAPIKWLRPRSASDVSRIVVAAAEAGRQSR
ncbi:MAG: protein kinase domain-containing protein [Methylovirgula sp.]